MFFFFSHSQTSTVQRALTKREQHPKDKEQKQLAGMSLFHGRYQQVYYMMICFLFSTHAHTYVVTTVGEVFVAMFIHVHVKSALTVSR